jgi:hypothetical protein
MTMRKQTSGWKWAIAMLLLAVGGWFVYRSMQPQLRVDAAMVDRGPMEVRIATSSPHRSPGT